MKRRAIQLAATRWHDRHTDRCRMGPLCQQITKWVDDEAEFVSDLNIRLEELRHQNQLSQTTQHYWGGDRQLLIHRYNMNDDLDFMQRDNIHCHLETCVFDESIYPFGLNKGDANLLKDIKHGLGSLKPPKRYVSASR